MGNQKNISATVRELITPTAMNMGLILWDVEFVREGARRVLRVTIDSPDGVGIDECEAFHRAIDPMLDEADPIDCSYYLEVSSPGIERELKNDDHLTACEGSEIEVTLYAPDSKGRKQIRGKLAGHDGDNIIIETGAGRETLARPSAAKVKTVFNFGD